MLPVLCVKFNKEFPLLSRRVTVTLAVWASEASVFLSVMETVILPGPLKLVCSEITLKLLDCVVPLHKDTCSTGNTFMENATAVPVLDNIISNATSQIGISLFLFDSFPSFFPCIIDNNMASYPFDYPVKINSKSYGNWN